MREGEVTNVHRISPGSPLPDEPVPETIKCLEELLELAKSGVIRHIAYAASKKGNVAMHGWSRLSEGDFTLSAAVGILFHDHFAELNKD
jgi:hypothetical protein